jgi:hypothetical protein
VPFTPWGEGQDQSFETPEACLRAYSEFTDDARGAGFVRVVDESFDPDKFDFHALRHELRGAIRDAYKVARTKLPGRRVNAFALLTDSSAMTIAATAGALSDFAAAGPDDDEVWNAHEWPVNPETPLFDPAYRRILTQHRGPASTIPFEEFAHGLHEACISALADERAEALFGDDSELANTFLTVLTEDGDVEGAVERLNHGDVVEGYRSWAG